jgi:predicted ribosome quality control (RQC) complex YloA/Tae2 family protein
VWAERKVMARQMSKEFLSLFKRDTLRVLEDQGILRRPRDYHIDTDFVPQLLGQFVFDLTNHREHNENLDSLLNYCMRNQAKSHRDSMVKEYKRREEKKKEEMRMQREREEQKRKRKEDRAAARERHRIAQLLDRIQTNIISAQDL